MSVSRYHGSHQITHYAHHAYRALHGAARHLAKKASHRRSYRQTSTRPTVGGEDGASNVNVVATGHVSHKRGVGMTKKHTPKVTKSFKLKVEAATRSKDISGVKEDIFYQSFGGNADNQQSFGWNNSTFVQPYPANSLWSFLPEYFLNAASVLFNGKDASNGGWFLNQAGNIGASPIAGGTVGANSAKFEVVNSFEHYKFRNNTNRGFTLRLYECAPKRPSNTARTAVDTLNVTVDVEDALQDPQYYWVQSMENDEANGYNLRGSASLPAATPSTIGITPSNSPSFGKGFKTGCTEVFMEAGTTYSYFLQGPSNMECDFKNYYGGEVFQNVQKFSRYLLPVTYSELISNDGTTGQVMGRLGYTAGALPGQHLFCERKMYVKIKMPEEAGLTATTATSGVRYLDQRKDTFLYQNWGFYGTAGTGAVNHDVLRQTEVSAVV